MTSMSMAGAREEALERVPYIYYPAEFTSTNKTQVQA